MMFKVGTSGWCFFFFNAISTLTTSEFLQFSSEDSPVLLNHKLQENDMAVDARKPATSLFHHLVVMSAHNDTQTLLNNPVHIIIYPGYRLSRFVIPSPSMS